MKIGDRITTPQGEGNIVDLEIYSRMNNAKRWGIELDNNPFAFPVAYYWEEELK